MLRMNTRVIKSCKKEFLCGNVEACLQKEKDVAQPWTFSMSERVKFIWASNTASAIMFVRVKSLCNTEPIAENKKEANE